MDISCTAPRTTSTSSSTKGAATIAYAQGVHSLHDFDLAGIAWLRRQLERAPRQVRGIGHAIIGLGSPSHYQMVCQIVTSRRFVPAIVAFHAALANRKMAVVSQLVGASGAE